MLSLAVVLGSMKGRSADSGLYQVGVAKIDMTPTTPIRLSGYGNRRAESEGVKQHLFAKALAIGSDRENPAVLITVDNVGVSAAIIDEVAERLIRKSKLTRDRIAVCFSHTHSGPMLRGVIPFIFGEDIPPAHQAHIDQYTARFINDLESVALAALRDREPARLAWGRSEAGFAKNRRPQGGPSDHDVPVLRVSSLSGKIRAVLVNYACHCTTVTGEFNFICGDWAGYAQEYLEADHPGAVVLTAIGCGADQNPFPRPGFDLAQKHGHEIQSAVNETLAATLTPIRGPLSCQVTKLALPFDALPTRAEWEVLSKKPGAIGYHARKNLERLDQGQRIPTELPYSVAAWRFGNDLAMVFLPGEVVVDYELRLKKEFDVSRLWVNAYANDAPCYIPSRRVLREGGYEGGGAMVYYDHPTRLAEPVEDLIVAAVHEVVPKSFLADQTKAELPPPLSPADALAAFRLKKDFRIELVVAEPLVVDPVAIDFGADGRLWVVEMRDYPAGLDGKYSPGGRIKVLESSRHNGHFDKATVFLDHLPFPTGIMVWGRGALICAAPDILYAEGSPDGGPAISVKKLFSGFATHNYQARVNGLRWGLDGWIYGAAGLFGGTIHSAITGRDVVLSGRDFRFKPDSGEFEPVSGLSQQGRVRDDFDSWFGCDNSTLAWNFPMPDRAIARNPFVSPPPSRVLVPRGAEINKLFPASRTLERFNSPESANRTTSACGLEIYRDLLLGREFYGNSFVCEPVHNLVHREILESDGITFTSHRASSELHSEFLSSTDNWFRPVEARTGPDGALWIVDMYRFVIEHPRWIPPERLARLDVRAGADKGRIYRVYPVGQKLHPQENLARMSPTRLVRALDSANGVVRDLTQRQLLERHDESTAPALKRLLHDSPNPAIRSQVLATLAELEPALLDQLMKDPDPRVVRLAVQKSGKDFAVSLSRLAAHPDPGVRFQLALKLGDFAGEDLGEALKPLVRNGLSNPWIRAALLSSATNHPLEILAAALAVSPDAPGRNEMVTGLAATTAHLTDHILGKSLGMILPAPGQEFQAWHFSALAPYFARRIPAEFRPRLEQCREEAGRIVADETKPESLRISALSALGGNPERIIRVVLSTASARLQKAGFVQLKSSNDPAESRLFIEAWPTLSPAVRAQSLELLVSREAWALALLDAVGAGQIAVAEISPVQRRRLLEHANPAVQSRAATTLAGSVPEARREVLKKYAVVADFPGNGGRGAAIFEKNCSICHALRGVGHPVGPDLAAWHDKPAQDFVVAVIDPNAVIEPRFINYLVETKSGRSLSGVISGETATSISLIQPGGQVETLLRSDLAEIKASPLSLMPEGLEQALTVQDLADLIAHFRN